MAVGLSFATTSPTFAGFSVSAAWGDDDLWDVGANYKGEIGAFTIAAKAGYGESTDPVSTKCGGSSVSFKCQWFGAGATVVHNPTGLYVFGGYGWQQSDTLNSYGVDDSGTTWLIQPGIEKKWTPLGTTTVFGEYRHDELAGSRTDTNKAADGANYQFVTDGSIDYWAGGVVQNIEAAAMDLYVIYRHTEGDITTGGSVATATNKSLDAMDMVITGARIQF